MGLVDAPHVIGRARRDDNAAAALLAGGRVISHAELDQRVAERRGQLGTARNLVLLRGGNELDFVVTYLAARSGRQPLILSSVEGAEPLIDRYAPDVVVTTISDDVDDRTSQRSTRS